MRRSRYILGPRPAHTVRPTADHPERPADPAARWPLSHELDGAPAGRRRSGPAPHSGCPVSRETTPAHAPSPVHTRPEASAHDPRRPAPGSPAGPQSAHEVGVPRQGDGFWPGATPPTALFHVNHLERNTPPPVHSRPQASAGPGRPPASPERQADSAAHSPTGTRSRRCSARRRVPARRHHSGTVSRETTPRPKQTSQQSYAHRPEASDRSFARSARDGANGQLGNGLARQHTTQRPR
jgi:hypothetical protein